MRSFAVLSLFLILIGCDEILGKLPPNVPGDTTPHRVEVAVGGSANITCEINLDMFNGRNSTAMYFIEKNTNRIVPATDIAILNESTIVYMLRNASAESGEYHCMCDKEGIQITNIAVGTSPRNVTDFSCRSYAYEYMVCNFTMPQNGVPTRYDLNFTVQNPRGNIPQNYVYKCDLETRDNQIFCNLTRENEKYKYTYEVYNFTLLASNSLGSNYQVLLVNHFESVIPPRPEFVVLNRSTDCLILSCELDYRTYKGLVYEVRVQPRNRKWLDWPTGDYIIHQTKRSANIELCNLPYAYYWYKISIRMRVNVTKNRNMINNPIWSEPFVDEFQTKPTIPPAPPKTIDGGFFLDTTETQIHLFWEDLPIEKENGPKFRYVITEVLQNNVIVNIEPSKIDRISAVISWQKDIEYEFRIRSRNVMGDSINASRIFVPVYPTQPVNKSPTTIKTVSDAITRTYTMSWHPPRDQFNLIDYTVFWCESKPAKHDECKGNVHFQRLSRQYNNFSMSFQLEEQLMRFAVSANYRDLNTGMHWTGCIADVNSNVPRLKPIVEYITSRTIKLKWSFDQLCTSHIEGYRLTYCEVITNYANDSQPMCLDENIIVTILEPYKEYVLTNLKPFSSYKIELLAYSKLKEGIPSEPLLYQTSEDAPSPPRRLRSFNVTRDSAGISWLPPLTRNGRIRFYTISYNNRQVHLNCTPRGTLDLDSVLACPDNPNTVINYELKDLQGFTNYRISVTASTVNASLSSNEIYLRTLIGIPSNPRLMLSPDHNHTLMQWEPPEEPSGPIAYYEVEATTRYRRKEEEKQISVVVGSTACLIHKPLCSDSVYEYSLRVRAVNVVPRDSAIDYHFVSGVSYNEEQLHSSDILKCIGINKTEEEQTAAVAPYRNTNKYILYKSKWEEGPKYGCVPFSISVSFEIIIPIVSIVLITLVAYYGTLKLIKMSHINIDLPPGLYVKSVDKSPKDSECYLPTQESAHKNELLDRLLTSNSHDCGFATKERALPPNGESRACSTSTQSTCSDYIGPDPLVDDNKPQQSVEATTPSTPSTEDSYMVMDVLQQSSAEPKKSNQDLQYKLDKNGYVRQTALDVYPSPTKPLISPEASGVILTNNGYVKPNQLLKPREMQLSPQHASAATDVAAHLSSSAYQTPQMLQQAGAMQGSFDGYTKLDALGKGPGQAPISTIQNDAPPLPPISGYVTQKVLSAFGIQKFS